MFFSKLYFYRNKKGFSLVEILIAAAILSLVFAGLFSSVELMVDIISRSKAETGALALANERIEYIRSLPYNDVATVGGIPAGAIPQNSTTTLNGLIYNERVLIEFIDDPADGTGAGDTNGIVADYKRVKVEYSWDIKGTPYSMSLITNLVPKGIETTAGGGSIRVNVFDASVQPIPGATVHLYNDTTTSTIDITRFTDSNGIALFSGAPASANYEIIASSTGYSIDQTYTASTSNPNPNPPHVAVVESNVSTMNFAIDQLSTLSIRTISPPTTGSFVDPFDNGTKIDQQINTVLSGGAVELSVSGINYASSGTVRSASTTPSSIQSWSTFDFVASTSASTSITIQLYQVTGTSTYTLVPDSALPNNSTGFISGPIDISALNTSTYDTLVLFGTLSNTDVTVTPALLDWRIDYVISETGIGTIPFTLSGNKSIGTNASSSPVLKYSKSHITDGNGDVIIAGLEWDIYDIALTTGTYDIASACNNVPYSLNPNVNETLTLTLEPSVSHSLRLYIADIAGDPIVGADVDLTRPGVNESETSSVCGQVFFNNGLASFSDYQLDVSKSGYDNQTQTAVDITGATTLTVTLSAS